MVSVGVGERDNVCGRNYSRGVLFGLKRVWPPSVGCGHDKTEALEEVKVAAEEEADTGCAAEREAACG